MLDPGNPNNYSTLTDLFFQIIYVGFLCDLSRLDRPSLEFPKRESFQRGARGGS
jgi:hypothetical protein